LKIPANHHKLRSLSLRRLTTALAAVALSCALAPAAIGQGSVPIDPPIKVKLIHIHYRAHNGVTRGAWVIIPSWYGPHDDPPIPLVISPHGRGVTALANAKLFGVLPAEGPFAVISPDGEGRKLSLYSWGSVGQIDDLARMPTIAHLTLPWLQIDHRQIYSVGGSMGGQETLLLLARHPKLLAGAAAFDPVTDLSRQYNSFERLSCNRACQKTWNGPIGKTLQALARREVGGSPWKRPQAYAERSPDTYVRAIASSCVPLELWWSVNDRVVLDQQQQTGAFFNELMKLNPYAPVEAYEGFWNHSAEMKPKKRLPAALALFGLVPPVNPLSNVGLHVFQPVSLSPGCSRPATPANTAAPLTPEPASAPVSTPPASAPVGAGSDGS
jgi:pimeloyl-ACP methyl ester carboxylesterase